MWCPPSPVAVTFFLCRPDAVATRTLSTQAYWPFHKAWCRSNDFADAVEATEPKFARWMRKHGKLAVLKDDEVDRIERKVRRTCWGTAGARGSFA